jgi:hypothetical protein
MPARPLSGEWNLANGGPPVKWQPDAAAARRMALANAVETAILRKMQNPGRDSGGERGEPLYFFPDQKVTAAEVRHALTDGGIDQRAWVISHLLRYAQWDDIWTYVTREEVRDVFPALDLPETLRVAWARMLKIETPVG